MARGNLSLLALRCPFLALALAAPFPAAGSAEPINVTGGSLLVVGRDGTVALTGDRDFALTANVDAAFGVFGPWTQCDDGTFACPPGGSVSLRAFWSGFDIRNGLLSFDGETHPVSESVGAASGFLEFSGSFVAPPRAETAIVTAPFRFTGGFSLPADSLSLSGRGTATVNLRFLSQDCCADTWIADSVRYEFSPVPEPGTIVLVGVGIAGLARRLTRRTSGDERRPSGDPPSLRPARDDPA